MYLKSLGRMEKAEDVLLHSKYQIELVGAPASVIELLRDYANSIEFSLNDKQNMLILMPLDNDLFMSIIGILESNNVEIEFTQRNVYEDIGSNKISKKYADFNHLNEFPTDFDIRNVAYDWANKKCIENINNYINTKPAPDNAIVHYELAIGCHASKDFLLQAGFTEEDIKNSRIENYPVMIFDSHRQKYRDIIAFLTANHIPYYNNFFDIDTVRKEHILSIYDIAIAPAVFISMGAAFSGMSVSADNSYVTLDIFSDEATMNKVVNYLTTNNIKYAVE